MALARLDIPSLMLYGGSIMPGRFHGERGDDPGRLRGGRRPRRGNDRPTRSSTNSRAWPRPGRARAAGSSPPTRWPWRSRSRASRRPGSAMVPGDGRAKSRAGRATAGELVMDVLARDLRPSEIITRRLARERDRRGRRDRRLDQRRAAPAGDRQRGRRRADIDDSTGSASTPRARRPEARRAVRRAGPVPRRRHAAARQAPAGGRAAPRTRTRSPGGRSARSRRRQRETPGQEVVRPLTTRSSRPAGSRFCRATSRPKGASSSSPATSAPPAPARRACSSPRRPRWPPCRARIQPGDWS